MSSSTLVHTCLRAELCRCAFRFEPYFEEEDEDRIDSKRRRITILPDQLPEDVLLEILLRLPVKSLFRFKCVCKHWYDLIRSPNFMTLHDMNSEKKKPLSLYFHSYIRNDNFTTISLGSFDDDVVPMELKVPVTDLFVEFVGCYNGIVCLSLTEGHTRFAVWNPATRQNRLISLSPPPRGAFGIYSGFFFDSVANTCKLVRVTFSQHKELPFLMEPPKPEGTVTGILYVFTLNGNINNRWRKKELFVQSRIPGGGNMSAVLYLKTCMYWIVRGSYYHPDKYILCLDVVDEVFKPIIELPCADYVYCNTELVDYKGSLGMFVWGSSDRDSSPGCCFDMWVLNDDCGRTWAKQLTLRPLMPNVMRPLCFFKKDGIDLVLLCARGQYLLWDTDSGGTTEVIEGNGSIYPFFLYNESFASVY